MLTGMASISLPAPLPVPSSFQTVPDMLVPTNPIHTRRTSRNPNIAPLPAFTFNPGLIDAARIERKPRCTGAGLQHEAQASELTRKSPPPLPAFSFNPGAVAQPESGSSSPTHPILEEMAQNRSRRTFTAAALPAFTFGLNSTEAQKTPSPTKSCFTPETPSSGRSIGHRRGASEIIGADEEAQASVTPHFNVSPQKVSHGPPMTGYGAPRSTHQHRRSQAVSVTEIETSELIKANAVAKHRGSSMPSTPTDLPFGDDFSRVSQSISSPYGRTPPASPRRRASATGSRPRVGFADTVDVIPRPLSMISSETEGSTSTVRGNHSLTGSISSLGSPAARPSLSLVFNDRSPVQRPRTADATSPSQHTSIGLDEFEQNDLPKRPVSASDSPGDFASSGSPANKKRFWFTPGGSNENSPKTTPKHTPTLEQPDPVARLMHFVPTGQVTSGLTRPKTSPERKASVKNRKVRTIAGAIFSRKARSRPTQSRGRRTPTPPLNHPSTNEITDAVFDEDNTVVISNCASPVQECHRHPLLDMDPEVQSLPSGHDDDRDDHSTSPVIDLDAALGPFGSEEKLPRKGFAAARSRMHSSMGRTVPDVLHRRAESAPQMPPINRSTFVTHRLASNTDVAEDVFDEEEEDDFLAEESKPRSESWSTPEQDGANGTYAPGSLHATKAVKGDSPMPLRSTSGLAISMGAPDGVEIVDAEVDITREIARSSDSTLSAPTLTESEIKESAPSTMTLVYPAPQSRYASSGEGRSAPGSAISSPDADHVSFDNYPHPVRAAVGTVPDPDLRSLTEDVPSLCDSVSTGNAPRFSSGAGTRSSADQHSDSFSAPPVSRNLRAQATWKRASLASLNRLIPGSSQGEKSRLRFEEPVEQEQEEKVKKKGNRISRLMNLWRPKQKENK